MSKNQLPVSVIYHKIGGKLEPFVKLDTIREDTFIKSLSEGDRVEVTFQVVVDDHSYGQLSKLHVCIRELAKETGDEFEVMKKLVKSRAGLQIDIEQDKYKSFANCSKEELSMAIQACLSIGDLIGCNLHSY